MRVAVVGDGPAGSALAQAIRRRGDHAVTLVGPDRPWGATYSAWVDDLDGVDLVAGHDIWLHRLESVDVVFESRRTVSRPYGVIDNDRLRAALRVDVDHLLATPTSADRVRTLVGADLVVDATGWPSALDPTDGDLVDRMAWQTAFGVVLSDQPSGSLSTPTIMDFTSTNQPVRGRRGGGRRGGRDGVATFAYSLPVADGWLVEETVLAGPALDPDLLVDRLASRLGLTPDAMLGDAVRVERVRIPMGVPMNPGDDVAGTVRFGAAAGMIHPATGYSVAGALRAADRVAAAVGSERVADAVWPTALRRTRRLHEYGLAVLLQMNQSEIRAFFETFFELGDDRARAFLRIDTGPRDSAAVMTAMFRSADWSLRRGLVSADPRRLLRVLRP